MTERTDPRSILSQAAVETVRSGGEWPPPTEETKLLRQIADDIAATRKAIESLAQRWGGGDWRTGPR